MTRQMRRRWRWSGKMRVFGQLFRLLQIFRLFGSLIHCTLSTCCPKIANQCRDLLPLEICQTRLLFWVPVDCKRRFCLVVKRLVGKPAGNRSLFCDFGLGQSIKINRDNRNCNVCLVSIIRVTVKVRFILICCFNCACYLCGLWIRL